MNSSRKKIRTGGSVFLVFGIILAPLVFLFLIGTMILKQNEIAAAERVRQAHQALSFMIESRRSTLNEYALWDEFYERNVLNDDFVWFDENIGVGMDGAQGRVATLLLDGTGKPLAGSWGPEAGAWSPVEFFGAGFSDLFDFVRNTRDGEGTLRFMPSERGPTIAQIGKVGPHNDFDLIDEGADPRYLVFVDLLDESVVEGLRSSLSWPDLSIVTEPGDARRTLEIHDYSGNAIGYLSWDPQRPGQAALVAAAPVIAAAFIFMIGSTAVVYRSIVRKNEALMGKEREASYNAMHDTLTGAKNRRALEAVLREEAGHHTAGESYVIAIDFDGFKEINDALGHRAGDALLVEMTRRMSQILPDDALLSRVGGDEFAVLGFGGPSDAVEIGQDIILRVNRSFEYSGHAVSVNASIGVSSSVGSAVSGEELLRRADVAMYEAKKLKASIVKVWDPAMEEGRLRDQKISEEIQNGLKNNEFWVALQPLFNLKEGRIGGFEALVRWEHPERGNIPPNDFIAIAERSRIIHDLGMFVLREACLKVRDLADVKLSVNLSPVQMLDSFLVDKIRATLVETGFPAERLELEVTEGYLIEQEERALDVLHRIKALGVSIALDDFGSGYASLGYLKRYPVDKLKIDRSFVTPIEASQKSREILGAIVQLAKAHDLLVTAEGVEEVAQAEILQDAGVDILQGWLTGKPEAEPAFCVPEAVNARFGHGDDPLDFKVSVS